MRKLLLAILSLFSVGGAAQDLVEFSTSMDFEEFEVVLKHLKAENEPLANEVASNVAHFKSSAAAGASQRYRLTKSPGYMTLEREDEYAVTVAIFTSAAVQAELESAHDAASEELGI